MSKVFVIDGQNFSTLEVFYEVVGSVLIPGQTWGNNLDAFNDILCWPLREGKPYVLIWKNSLLSRARLNHEETVRQLEIRLSRCHPANRRHVAGQLKLARLGKGPTVFDWLVEIIERHADWVTLKLA